VPNGPRWRDLSHADARGSNFYGAEFPKDIRQHLVRDWYPAGAEKLLIRDAVGIELKQDEIPSQCGLLVLNIQTVLAVRDAVYGGRAQETRYITASDLDRRTGTVVKVRLGNSVRETAGRVLPNAVNVYTGGGAMSARLSDDGAVIGEKTNFISVGSVRGFREALCSRCNLCSAYCPAGLPVRDIARWMDDGKPEKAASCHPETCFECNLCSSVCPAGRDQARRIRTAKKIRV
jgi:electron transport complex protein RnfC